MVVQSRGDKRRRALELRRRGCSYKEIINRLHIAKSTLSYWINNYLAPEEEKKIRKITVQKGRKKIIRINKKRSAIIKKKEREEQRKCATQVLPIDKKKLFWLGMGLYLAKRAKTDRWKAVFYNSSPQLNRIMIRFFREVCLVPERKIHVQLVLHEGVPEKGARGYWGNLLGIPGKNFYGASYVKSRASKRRRPKNRLPYGTVQLSISGKETANKVKGWMLGIKDQFAGVVQ